MRMGQLASAWDEGRAMLSTGASIFSTMLIGSVAGWLASVIAARLYPPAAVAVAGAILSMTALTVAIANFGLTTLVLQHLRRSSAQRELVGSVYILSALFSLAAAVMLIPAIPDHHPLVIGAYVCLVVTTLVYSIHEVACYALGLAPYVVRRTALTQILRLACLVPLASLGSLGMIASVVIGTTIMVVWVHVRVLTPRLGPAIYRVPTTWALVRSTAHRLGANYVNDWLAWVPTALFPIIVLHTASPRQSAISYIVLMVALTFGSIPGALVTAEFSRRSGEEAHEGGRLRGSTVALILLLAGLTSVFAIPLAPAVLMPFGGLYRVGGALPLQIMLAALVPITGRALFVAHCRLSQRPWDMVLLACVSAPVIVTFVTMGAVRSGVDGAALGWTMGQWCAAILALRVTYTRSKVQVAAYA